MDKPYPTSSLFRSSPPTQFGEDESGTFRDKSKGKEKEQSLKPTRSPRSPRSPRLARNTGSQASPRVQVSKDPASRPTRIQDFSSRSRSLPRERSAETRADEKTSLLPRSPRSTSPESRGRFWQGKQRLSDQEVVDIRAKTNALRAKSKRLRNPVYPSVIPHKELDACKKKNYHLFAFAYSYAMRRQVIKQKTGRYVEEAYSYTGDIGVSENGTYLKRRKKRFTEREAKRHEVRGKAVQEKINAKRMNLREHFPSTTGSNYNDLDIQNAVLAGPHTIANDAHGIYGALQREMPPLIGGMSHGGEATQLFGNVATIPDAVLGVDSVLAMKNAVALTGDRILQYGDDSGRFWIHLLHATPTEAEAFLLAGDVFKKRVGVVVMRPPPKKVTKPQTPDVLPVVEHRTAQDVPELVGVKSVLLQPTILAGSTATVIAAISTASPLFLPVGDIAATPLGVMAAGLDIEQGLCEIEQQLEKKTKARARLRNMWRLLEENSSNPGVLPGIVAGLTIQQERLIRQAKRDKIAAIIRIVKGAVSAPLSLTAGALAASFLASVVSIVAAGATYGVLGGLGFIFGIGMLARKGKQNASEHTSKWRQRAARAVLCIESRRSITTLLHERVERAAPKDARSRIQKLREAFQPKRTVPATQQDVESEILPGGPGALPGEFVVEFEQGDYVADKGHFAGQIQVVADVFQNEYIALYALACEVHDMVSCVYPYGEHEAYEEKFKVPFDDKRVLIDFLKQVGGIDLIELHAICRATQGKPEDQQLEFIQSRLAPAFGMKFRLPKTGRQEPVHPSFFLKPFVAALALVLNEGDLPFELQILRDAAEKELNDPTNREPTRQELNLGGRPRLDLSEIRQTAAKIGHFEAIEMILSNTFRGSIDWRKEFDRSISEFLQRTQKDADKQGPQVVREELKSFLTQLRAGYSAQSRPEEAEKSERASPMPTPKLKPAIRARMQAREKSSASEHPGSPLLSPRSSGQDSPTRTRRGLQRSSRSINLKPIRREPSMPTSAPLVLTSPPVASRPLRAQSGTDTKEARTPTLSPSSPSPRTKKMSRSFTASPPPTSLPSDVPTDSEDDLMLDLPEISESDFAYMQRVLEPFDDENFPDAPVDAESSSSRSDS